MLFYLTNIDANIFDIVETRNAEYQRNSLKSMAFVHVFIHVDMNVRMSEFRMYMSICKTVNAALPIPHIAANTVSDISKRITYS